MRDESCIQALTIGSDQAKPSRVKWLGLVETFDRSEHLASVVHTSPGARVAQIQLLLGLCYATGVYPRTLRQWLEWNRERRPLKEVAERLRSSDFDGLLDVAHPEHPFGQNRLLAPFLDAHGYGPAQLSVERCGDYNQLFDHMHLHDPEPMSVEEAVVAMLTQHAYGLGGRERAKVGWQGRAFTFGSVGRLGARVHTLALGETLADTLRLNLMPFPKDPGETFGGFNFSWTRGPERRSFTGAGAQRRRTPTGPADLHSVLGRSVLLRPVRTPQGRLVVDRVLMGAGELLEPLGPQWMPDAVMDGDRPLQPSADKALWRDAHALYAACGACTANADLYSRLARLERPVTLWSVGLVAKQRAVTGWVTGTFPYAPGRADALHAVSGDAVQWSQYVASAVSRAAAVARDIAYPNARPEERASLLARFDPGGALWGRFEEPFHLMLAAVAGGERGAVEENARQEFATELVHAARQALTERLRGLPGHGHGRQARMSATARLESELTRKSTPHHLKEAAVA
ncbi:type I-E CRISPR-associated protein Cse1/CasA [Streptomyces chrestomyceticus]|uniref:type I-E CRISPR-associated protein Cse1/CasA n=1 Tax=Streptomyces chrestomyceticus TaxID=68185 RepID=UPI0034058804